MPPDDRPALLLVEDDEGYARLLRAMLAANPALPRAYRVEHVTTLRAGLDALRAETFEVALLDLGLPDAEGLEPVEAVHAQAPRLPLVVLSGQDDVDVAVAAMRRGAQEYLVKGQAEEQLLPRAIRYAVERKRSQDFEQMLVGVVSHDLRGPMQTISLTLDLFEDYDLGPDASGFLSRARRATHRARGLVDDLLDLTQIRLSGQLGVEPGPIDLAELVRQVVDEHRGAHPSRRIALEAPERCPCEGDGRRLGQVVGNLLGNALQHGHGDHEITVRLDADADRCRLSFHNRGEPIPEPLRHRLFEPLERAAARGGSAQKGSLGLGLFIVREIIRAHHGRIDVRSSAEEGTVFTVSLPRHSSR